MKRAFLSALVGLALAGGAFAQAGPGENGQLTMTGANEYDFSWQGRVGRFYFIQQSEDLIRWAYVPGAYGPGVITNGVEEILAFHFSVSGTDRFFVRLKVLEPYSGDPLSQDYDGDKVTAIDEIDNGTDPFDSVIADTDMDGMPDDWEIHFGLLRNNPNDATLDADEDGIDNLTEYGAGGDPTGHYNGSGYPSIIAVNRPTYPPVDEPGTLLAEPLVFEVKAGATPVNHTLVTVYTESPDLGQLSPHADGSELAPILHLWTGADGRVQVYFKHPSAIALEPTERRIHAKVGSATIRGNGNSVTPPIVVVTQSDYIYPDNTVGKNASDSIDNRIATIASNAVADAKRVFSAVNHAEPTPTYERNTASWCYNLRQQMTCISPYYSRGGIQYGFTAVTQQHVITSAHVDVTSLLNVGDTVRFITADNVVVTKIIQGKKRHPNYGIGNVFDPDFTVCTLDSPLPPTITPCKMLPANYASYLGYLGNGRPPAMVLNQFEQASVAELRDLGTFTYPYATFARPGLHRKRLEFYNELDLGDSGNPAFLIIKPPDTGLDTLVLLTTWTGGGAGTGTFTTPQISALNAMIAAADADATTNDPLNPINTGLQVQTIDLSGFNSTP